MIVRIEGVDAAYKGSNEFKLGSKILDVSVPTLHLSEDVDLKGCTSYKHRFPGGELYIVDVNLTVQERSLLMEGLIRNRTAGAPKQTIMVDSFMAQRQLPVILRHEGIPYPGALRFELPETGAPKDSEAMRFVKQFKWPV